MKGVYSYNPETKYYGRICEKHPELNGLRRKARRGCPACESERRAELRELSRADPEKKEFWDRKRELSNARGRKWRMADPERAKSTDQRCWKNWIENNRERHAATTKAWAAANPEKRKVSNRNYRLRNPEKVKARKIAYLVNHPADRAKNRIACRAYAKRNPDKCAEKTRRWRAANPEREKANQLAWIEKNRVKRAKQRRDWRAANLDKCNLSSRKYQSLKLRATPTWANDFYIEEAYELAILRQIATGFAWHIDHIVPLNSKLVCGLHCEDNLQVIPGKLNISKSNRYWPDMPN